MYKKFGTVLLLYILMQFSGVAGIPLLEALGIHPNNLTRNETMNYFVGLWGVISFTITLFAILFVLKEELFLKQDTREKLYAMEAIGWSAFGVFLAIFTQWVAVMIETYVFHIPPGSENTESIIGVAKVFPLFIVVIGIIAPILEELIFRRIIYKTIADKYNFWIGALASSLIFAVLHTDFSHILVYAALGFSFAYLYERTGRIWVPMISHMAMNSLVVALQLLVVPHLNM